MRRRLKKAPPIGQCKLAPSSSYVGIVRKRIKEIILQLKIARVGYNDIIRSEREKYEKHIAMLAPLDWKPNDRKCICMEDE